MTSRQILLRGLFAQMLVGIFGILGICLLDFSFFMAGVINGYQALNALGRMLACFGAIYLLIKAKDNIVGKFNTSFFVVFILFFIILAAVSLLVISSFNLWNGEWPNMLLMISVVLTIAFGVISLAWSFIVR